MTNLHRKIRGGKKDRCRIAIALPQRLGACYLKSCHTGRDHERERHETVARIQTGMLAKRLGSTVRGMTPSWKAGSPRDRESCDTIHSICSQSSSCQGGREEP